MPDVPKRCPKCGALYRKFFSRAHSYYCDSWVEPETGTDTEAERWRKQYEALRAGVERVADDLHMAADEAYDNWRITADFNEQGRSIGLEEAEQMVRRLLAKAGGGDR